ncbi:MAG: hypothetical protein ACOYKZ_00020 [Chlamydiia bacterium]
MKLRLAKLPTGIGWGAWLLIAPLAGWTYASASPPTAQEGYTVNFSNVSVREFIRFISRATGQNFIFEDENLDFPITVISEDPTGPENLMTALIQLLRARGYSLIEQGDNLVIHKSTDVSQVAKVITSEGEHVDLDSSAIVTRVFRLDRLTPDAAMPILQPLVSASAKLEASPTTKQLILTDVSTNVAKVAELLKALDAPNHYIVMGIYETKSPYPAALVDQAKSILAPLIDKTPFLLEPGVDDKKIFIVSTQYLIDQTKEVLQAIEEAGVGAQQGQPFLYPVHTQSAPTLLAALREVSKGLEDSGVTKSDLLTAIQQAKAIPSNNSLLFTVDQKTQQRLSDLLKELDGSPTDRSTAATLLYQPQSMSTAEMQKLLTSLADALSTQQSDPDLEMCLRGAREIPGQGFLFTASQATLNRLQELLKSADGKLGSVSEGSSSLLIYHPKNLSVAQLRAQLAGLESMLRKEGDSDEALFRTLNDGQGLLASNSILFGGPPATLKKLQAFLNELDVPAAVGKSAGVGSGSSSGGGSGYNPGTLVAIPLRGDSTKVFEELKATSATLDPGLSEALSRATLIPQSNTLLMQGDEGTIAAVRQLLMSMGALATPEEESTVIVYRPMAISLPALQAGVADLAMQLQQTAHPDTHLLEALSSARISTASNSLVFTAPANAQKQLEALLKQIDQAVGAQASSHYWIASISTPGGAVAALEKLRSLSSELQASGLANPSLLAAIQMAQIIDDGQSIAFSSDDKTLSDLQALMQQLDKADAGAIAFYSAKNMSASALKTDLVEFLHAMGLTAEVYRPLQKAADSALVMADGKTLSITGEKEPVQQIENLLNRLDQPQTQAGSVYLYHIPANTTEQATSDRIVQFTQQLKQAGGDRKLIAALQSGHYMPDSNAIAFKGDSATLDQLPALLAELHPAVAIPGSVWLYVLPPTSNPTEVLTSVDQFARGLRARGGNHSLIAALESRNYLTQSNSIAFNGDEATLKALQSLMKDLQPAGTGTVETLTYQAKNVAPDALLSSLKDAANKFSASGGAYSLIRALQGAQTVGPTHAIVIQIDPMLRPTVESLLASLDTAQGVGTVRLIPIPAGVSSEQYIQAIDALAAQVGRSQHPDPSLESALRSRALLGESRTLSFTGSANVLDQLPTMLSQLQLTVAGDHLTSFAYRPVHMVASALQQSLESVAQNLQKAGANSALIAGLRSAEALPNGRGLLFTMDTTQIDAVKAILTDLDVPTLSGTSLFIYPIQQASIADLENSLAQIAEDLAKTGAPLDQQIAAAMQKVKVLTAAHSLLFSGPTEALEKIQKLIPTLDVAAPGPAVQPDKPQLFLYRAQAVPVAQIEAGLTALEKTLLPNSPDDQALLVTLKGAHVMPDGKSILFTGTPSTLARLQATLTTLDGGPGANATVGTQFLIYRLQSATPERVESSLRALAQSLQKSGLEDDAFFRSVANMQIDHKSNALVFSGGKETFSQLQPIIAVYDVRANSTDADRAVIEPVSNTTFMVYKLRYLQGNEIENTLRQMGAELLKINPDANKDLVHAIGTMQWIQSSNTLCCSGVQDTLEKLRSIIANIDVPLKQVFIEVLVIKTSLQNSYNFQLDWVGQGVINPNFAVSLGNASSAGTTTGQGSNSLPPLFDLVTSTGINQPVTTSATESLLSNQFSMGAIGNIVRHCGKTYFDLGSLVNAIETDQSATVVINPKLIAQDSNTSTMFRGQTLGFITQQTQVFSTATSNATTIDYRTVGVNLTITPIISGDVVTLEIDQTYSNVSQGFTPTPGLGALSGAGAFPTDILQCSTRAHVPDQAILCISGMLDRDVEQTVQRVPCLGAIPLLGALFSSEANSDTRQNIMVFIKPYIIASLDEMRAVTQNNAKLIREGGDCYTRDEVQEGFDQIGYDKIPLRDDVDIPCDGDY